MRIAYVVGDAVPDSVFALRSFRRSPGWTLVTLLTIALGVGASTAVFSVADTFLLRPLAYRDASRVYNVSLQGTVQRKSITLSFPSGIVREWRNSARTIEAAAAYGGNPAALLPGDPDDVRVSTAMVDTSFLAFTGTRPLIGRNFTADDTAPNGPRAIMLAEGFWRRQFGASPDVVGKVVRLDVGGEPESRLCTIVGVMPASLALPDFDAGNPDVWLPLIGGERARVRGVAVRLKPGVSPHAASEEMTAIFTRAVGIEPDDKPLRPRIRVSRPQDDLPFRQALLLLTGAVILLLLIACSNVSHLLLQRGVARERELAVRHALGAHRSRLVRQLVAESVWLGVVGGALAMLVGWSALEVLARFRPTSLPALERLTTTRGVIPFAGTLSIAVGLIVGVLGALRVAHGSLGQTLRVGASTSPLTHRRLRGSLVVGQIALSTILLAGAVLLIRTVVEFERVRLGFDPQDLYEVSFREGDINAAQSPERLAELARMIRGRAERAIGSRDLTIAGAHLPGEMAFASTFETRERPGDIGPSGMTGAADVAPDYFSVMRMPLLAGRTFDEGSASRHEVIVNSSLARQLGYQGNVVGRQFRNSRREGAFQEWHTIVGVVLDILANRLDRTPTPMLYRPFPGTAIDASLLVRLPRKDAADVLRRFAKSVQPDPLTWRVIDVNDRVEQSIAEPRFTMTVLVLFALCGVILAAIGLFGVMSYTLSLRTREIGVRVTLGATRRHVASLFVRAALGQAAFGTAIGLAGALGVERLARMSFYGVERIDTSAFILTAASMLLASLMACAGPLFRATRVDPVVAIRAD